MYTGVGVMAIGELLPRDFVEVKSQFFPATRIPVRRVPAWGGLVELMFPLPLLLLLLLCNAHSFSNL